MLSDDEFRHLLKYLNRPWAGFRKVRKGVKKRVRRHMEQLDCRTFESYLRRIESDPQTFDACEQCLRVTISRFFRDRRLWECLGERLLPEMMGQFPDGLTAWSAGCANGEEPYTLSMVWEGLIGTRLDVPALEIVATDNDEICLERAGKRVYPLSSLKEVPEDFKKQWFRKDPGSRQWQVDAHLQHRIALQVHDLLDPPPREIFHLIFMRNNLLTYYQGSRMENAFKRITGTLVPGGLLIVGSHERLPAADLPLKRDSGCPWVFYR